ILALVIFQGSYNSLLYFGKYTPFYELIIIFYWAMFLPRSVPLIILVLMGLFRDFLLLHYIGVSVISFVALKIIVSKQSVLVKDRSFSAIFMLFGIAIFIVCIFKIFILLFLYETSFMAFIQLFAFRIMTTLMLYIPAHFVFASMKERMLGSEDA
nr:rod shape-determining protein MreD [Alphaproteobacteria bacterium]